MRKVLLAMKRLLVAFPCFLVGLVWPLFAQTTSGSQAASSIISLLVIVAVVLGWMLGPVIICYRMATRKRKSHGLWIFLAILFGWLAGDSNGKEL